MRRRTGLLATVMLVAAIGALGPSPGAAGPAAGRAAASDAPADPAAVAATVERQTGDRYGGYWVDDGTVHVNVVEPTAEDRDLAGDRLTVHEATQSYDELVAARDAVAGSLDRQRNGNYAVDLDVPANGVTVETERGDPAATRMLALDALDDRANVHPNADPGDDGPSDDGPGGISLDRLNVLTGSDVGIVPLGAGPTDFPPYEAGLHLGVTSGGTTIRCTSGFAFADARGTYGSTAGHCGRRTSAVRVADTLVGRVAINAFENADPVRADTALYTLPEGTARPVIHGSPTHPRVAGSLADSQIGIGMRLCFDGRASGIGACGTVDAVGRRVCCDAEGRSFVFTCVGRTPGAGDSGGPVYQPLGGNEARAAGTLSSSVRLDGRRSMCFSTIDQIEQQTGTQLAG